jgi:phosphoribosylglycinamide formyltransferase-1
VIGVLVSGNGTNLQALLDAQLPVAAVASNRSDAYALERAHRAGIVTAVFPLEEYGERATRDAAMAGWLRAQGVDVVVLAGYMHVLTRTFLERFPRKIVNVHPSLLPEFPGAHAVDEALAAGVAETGATVHIVDDGVATGPILVQERVRVEPGDTPETLHARIQQVEHRILPAVVRQLCAR